MPRLRAHAFVSGRVQGVWFRESTRQRATELGLSGFVRNLADGRVEALFEGEAKAVRQAIEFVRRGPPHARVSDVELDCAGVIEAGEGSAVEDGGGSRIEGFSIR
jgi:acylphosphatase